MRQNAGRGNAPRAPRSVENPLAKSPLLQDLAVPGTEFALRVTPRASRNALTRAEDGSLRCSVTVVPEDGKANAAVRDLLAAALGVAKSRLTLVRGQTARDKVFRLD